MANILDIFEKIIVDGKEINPQSLVLCNGIWNVKTQKDVEVEYIFKNNTLITPYAFTNLKQLSSAYLPNNIKFIGKYAFANSSLSYISDLSYVKSIGEQAFSYTKLTHAYGFDYDQNQQMANNAFSYIKLLTEEAKELILSYHPNADFGDFDDIDDNIHIEPNPNEGGNEGQEGGNEGGSSTDYDPWEDYINYSIGDKYKMPLIYRNNDNTIYRKIGEVTFEIIDIDQTVNSDDPFKVKFNIKKVTITNPLDDQTIDHQCDLLNRSFWAKDLFLTANINTYKTTIPEFVDGVDGVDSFLMMKISDSTTYYPELENLYGMTNYAIRKTLNDVSQFKITT